MNAAQFRRLEAQLSLAEEFFLEQEDPGEPVRALQEDLRILITKVVAERVRAEANERRSPGSRRPW